MAESVLASMLVKIAGNTTQFQGSMAQAQKSLKSLEQTSQATSKTLNSALSFAGAYVGAQQLFGVISSAVGTIRDFEQQMATVQAITGATGSEFDSLRNSALDLSKATRYTATQIAQLQTEYGRLGFSTQEILNATEATLDLATATGEDLAKSADVLGSTLRAFGIDASETARVADVMAGAFNKSALGLENFSEAIKYVAPVAASANISLEETTALLGILADNGIRGSMAGTSLRKIISDVGGETGTLSERLKKLADKGISGAAAMDEVGRTAYASLLILIKNTEKTGALAKALENTAGEAKKAAAVMGDTLSGDIDKLKASYDSLIISGGGLSDSLREIVQAATNLINAAAKGSGVTDFFKTLISYTPNLYTLSKAINAITDKLSTTKEGVQKLIARTNELRIQAIQKGDQKAALEYTKIIAELTAKYGLLSDKAVEFKEDNPLKPEELDISIESLDKLKKKLEDLTNQYITFSKSVDSTADIEKLKGIDDEIKGTKSLIDTIEKYRKKSADVAKEKRKEFALFNSERQSIYGLAQSYIQLQEEIKQSQIELGKFLNSFNAVTKIPEQIKINDGLAEQIRGLNAAAKQAAQETIDLGPMIASGITGIADALGTALATNDFANFGDAILEAVASFAQQLGAQLIALGVAEVAMKVAASNPVALIAAGAALVAAGAAVKSTLSKQSKVISSSGSASGGGSSYQSSQSSANISDSQNSIQLSAETVIRGQDLYVIFSKYQENNRSTRANG